MPYTYDKAGRKILSFKCLCDCGKETIVRSNNLLSGNTTSCGCQSSKYKPSHKLDLTGERYGHLTVLSEYDNKRWNCICDCGNSCVVWTVSLRTGNTKSCGCLQKERAVEGNLIDLCGMKFGLLTVVKRIEDMESRRYKRRTYYECLCECGNTTIVEAYSLKIGDTKSCGCLKSAGERKVEEILKQMCICYEKQYTFDDLLGPGGGKLMFDFCIHENNTIYLIEYQGMQHYIDGIYFGRQQREVTDKTKKEYCKPHNINLFEIRYDEEIENSLHNILKTIHANTVPSSEEKKV